MRALIALAALLAACGDPPPRRCDELARQVASCVPEVPEESLRLLRAHCAADMYPAFRECNATATCDAMKTCLDDRNCRWVFTSPDDRVPEMMCDFTPAR